ncbi:uncharacterized protein Z519_05301 [Cladophialophora bantiana CBS 173.52]|uniref:Uncharacterized protein n=1 Tax=Cladophialophora bantiana (strain ATCC 10958 / CBS 173.52 / CDC B-1940 / NIH 8579) TaxID=1442370 RepID=A0A0D2EVY9_CLAB1|nr:uncharacterized protein Z519_05301 [Cladophialophora bantiana CBS 173.52]KIW93986.1 hypothetical protein Z519_05301 [Cladophialophora bantiana CBS 173.52]
MHDNRDRFTGATGSIGSIPGSWVEYSAKNQRRDMTEPYNEDSHRTDTYKERDDSIQKSMKAKLSKADSFEQSHALKEEEALERPLNPQEIGTGKGIGVGGIGPNHLDEIRMRMKQMYKAVIDLAEQNTILASQLREADQHNITWQAQTPEESDGKGSCVGKETEPIAALEMSRRKAEDEAQRLKDANAKLDVKLAEVERKCELVMRVLVAVVAAFLLAMGINLGT